MAYAVSYTETARRQLLKLPRQVQPRIARAVNQLGVDPRPPGCRKIIGTEDVWRIRIGSYRVLYRVRESQLEVIVIRVADRKDA